MSKNGRPKIIGKVVAYILFAVVIVGMIFTFSFLNKKDAQEVTHFDNTEVIAYSSDGDAITSQVYYTYKVSRSAEKQLKNESSEIEISDLEQYMTRTLNNASRKVFADYSMNEIAITKINEIEAKILKSVEPVLADKDIEIQEVTLGIPIRDERKSLNDDKE